MPTQSLQGGIHGVFPSSSPRRSGLDDVVLGLAVAGLQFFDAAGIISVFAR